MISTGDVYMDIMELMKQRHSVRQYLDKTIPLEIREQLEGCIEECNREGNLHIQVLYDEPECFQSRLAHYGSFRNVKNYIVMAGEKKKDLAERCGYYGEKIVLKAQELGLNTCWVALTHGKSKAVIAPGEKEVIIISLGYGENQGKDRKSKTFKDVSDIDALAPDWYFKGIQAALLAPTAVNQQKFRFSRDGNTVHAEPAGLGTNLKVDLGIVKCHFELGAGKENFTWK